MTTNNAPATLIRQAELDFGRQLSAAHTFTRARRKGRKLQEPLHHYYLMRANSPVPVKDFQGLEDAEMIQKALKYLKRTRKQYADNEAVILFKMIPSGEIQVQRFFKQAS